MMKKVIGPALFALALLVIGAGCASVGRHPGPAAEMFAGSFETKVTKIMKAKYLIYLPKQYEGSERSWPLMLFLHGAGERGDDLEKIKIHGPPKLIAAQAREFPFVVVSPQCPEDGWWSDHARIETLDALLDHISDRYRIDPERIYVTGLSMGGYGTWALAAAYPERFAAIAPICGGGDPDAAASISHLPVWVFHGDEDKVVAVEQSQQMVDALKKAGGNVKFTVYAETGHDSWTRTYENPALYEWFLKHRRSGMKE
jgi:predicted peptidase